MASDTGLTVFFTRLKKKKKKEKMMGRKDIFQDIVKNFLPNGR